MGICVGRSVELIVSILGVLRSGAAYVPIDPAYPAERIDFIVDDAQLTLVVTSGPVDHLPAHIDVVDLAHIGDAPDTAPSVVQSADDIAYVIHTSGSTGRPKGVPVRHRNIVASTTAREAVYPNPVERFLLLSSFAFDSSMVGIFWTLCTGGTLVLPSAEAHDDVLRLVELVERRRVTHTLALPSLYRLMATEARPAQLSSLNTVIVAGEACRPDVIEAHRACCPRAVLSNEYGPTEGTVWSHAFIVDEQYRSGPVPIGSPIPGTVHVVLGPNGRPVPDGEPGELYIGGRGIAAGYLRRDDLTAERFVQLDAGSEAGHDDIWYRTGDLVRADSQGRLTFLGRVDQQVKVRGFRIEPGEVEAVLLTSPLVDDIAVDARDVGGRSHLTAWFVSAETPTAAGLRDHVAAQLPSHMVPTFFVHVDRIPLLPNGKTDRAALPDPETATAGGPRGETGAIEPRQQLLAAIWADVLGVESVGPDDNFFDLGGDSIISLQIVARARRAGIELRPRDVFDHQTVREIVEVAASPAPATIETGPVSGEVPLTPIQHWFFEQEFVEWNHWNQSMWLDLDPNTDVEVLGAALAVVCEHHDQLRAAFDVEPGGVRQRILETPVPPYVEVVELGDSAAALERNASTAEGSLDIGAGRNIALLVCTTDGRPTRLLVTVHHLVVDGVSWSPMIEDWAAAYAALVAGDVPRLPPRSTSFQSWSRALTGAADDARFAGSRSFWDATVTDSDDARALRTSAANTEESARTVIRSLDADETAQLLRSTGASNVDAVTVEDLLLTSATIAVPPRLGQSCFTAVLEGHGREELVDESADISRTVGWFTSQFPITLAVSDPADLDGCLDEVRTQLRGIPERGIAFGIERYLVADSPLRAVDFPTTAFNYLGQLDRNFAVSTPFAAVRELVGAIDPANRRPHLLGLLCVIHHGRLVVTVDHLPDHLPDVEAAALADDLIRVVRSLIDRSPAAKRATGALAEFDLVDLSESDASQLSSLLDQLDD